MRGLMDGSAGAALTSGSTAHYVLTSKARTFRISKGAIEYRVASKAIKKVKGLPGSTDLAGFLH